jgi:hypothetical protein
VIVIAPKLRLADDQGRNIPRHKTVEDGCLQRAVENRVMLRQCR